jgi:hypothetical protein
MDPRPPERTHARPAPRRRGWIPLGLPGQILLVGLIVPAAALAPEAGAADALGRAGRAVAEQAGDGYDAVAGWVRRALDPRTSAGDSARDERWASSRR